MSRPQALVTPCFSVSKEEIALLVLRYLESEGFTQTFHTFKSESLSLLKNLEIPPAVKQLTNIMQEYIRLKWKEVQT